MATFQTSGRSLYDMVKNLDADGNAVKTAEVLQKACPMLQDAPVVTANNVTTHKISVRTGLPSAEVKRLNQGVGGSFGSRETYEFGMKEYQALPWIDKLEFKYAKDPNEVRQSNMEGILQGWGQSLESDFLYDKKSNGLDNINGIDSYCGSLDGNRVINGGASTVVSKKVMSIYLVAWDTEMGAFAIAPQGDTAGVKFNVLGDHIIADPNNSGKQLLVEQYEVGASLGFGVKDKRAIARIANIDCTTVGNTTFNPEWLMKAINQFPTWLRNKIVIYVPHEIELAMQMAANVKSNASFVYGQKELYAETLSTFNGLPIRVSEAIVPQTAIVA